MFQTIQTRMLINILATALLLVGATTATAESTGLFTDDVIRGYDYQGAYLQFGVSVGRVDFDRGIDSDASGGFTMTGGYRALRWLALEGNFSYLGGKDNAELRSGRDRDTEFWAFTFGPKIYPLGFVEDEVLTAALQPYGLIQIGGGEIEIDGTDLDESSFIARFIIGFDIWATDSFGFFVEGGGFAADDSDVDGAGVFTVGGQYRF